MKKWFINEDLGVYTYDPATQRDDFPNDFPLAYDTEAEAEDEAERMWGWEFNGPL
jgi:hypothetical protein